MRLDEDSFIMLGQGCNQRIICSTVTSQTSCTGADLAMDKDKTKQILAGAYLPVPKGLIIHSIAELEMAIQEIPYPLVIKPSVGNHGKGITTNIRTKEKALFGYNLAKKFSKEVMVEQFVTGYDYRLLLVNYKLVAAARRTPACVVGDGLLTIQQLIDQANEHPDRGIGHQKLLTKITIDESTLSIIADNQFTLDTILPAGYILYLKSGANISSGGTALDVTHLVHPVNIVMAERIARLMHLDICGIDIVTDDIATPITEQNGGIIEVNAGPGLRMHLAPSEGRKRNVAKPIINMLFPNGTPSRIPLVAVTGTNGKTTTVRLIAYFARKAGYCTGFTTTDGIYLQDQKIYKGDCSGPLSASAILRDPLINFAVLECARGGILRSGLGYDKCSVSIVTNISEDHLGQDDIHTLEKLARVKSVVPRSTSDNGYAILNADDDRVYAMKHDLKCNIALFSMISNNELVEHHCSTGGTAAYLEKGFFILQKGPDKHQVAKINDIPLTFSGQAKSMIKNILPAILAAFVNHFNIEDIAKWLFEFKPTAENIPGRMNLFTVGDEIKVLLDYAHNEEAFIELRDFIEHVKCKKKIGIVAATGDRRPEDIKKVGFYAAQTFDEIIIRQDRDSRGRTHEELINLVMEGINQYKENSQVKIIPNEFEAIQYAIDTAEPDTFILYFPDEVSKAVDYLRQQEQKSLTMKTIEGSTSA